MSTNLYWEPVEPHPANSLPDKLKFVLRETWGWPVKCTLDSSNIGFFRGLAAAGIDGAKEVVELLEKYDAIKLEER